MSAGKIDTGKQKARGDDGESGGGVSVSAQEELDAKQTDIDAKQTKIDALNASAVQTQAEHGATIEGLNVTHQTEKQEIIQQHQTNLDNLIETQKRDHSQEITELKEVNKKEITELKRECDVYEKEAKSVIKIGDNISFKIVDDDGDFNESAFKILENLKTKIENAIVEAKRRRDGEKEEIQETSKEEISKPDLSNLLEADGGTGTDGEPPKLEADGGNITEV